MNYSYFSYTRVIAALAFFAGIILLWPGGLFFLNDDFVHLSLTAKGRWLQQQSFRPICDLSMWIDYKLWNLNATGFHITNVLLHLANSFLLYRFSRKFLVKYHQAAVAPANAMLIATIFFVYAFHAETLYWVIGRSASLGALFFLLGIDRYTDRHASKRNFSLSLLFFCLGLLTYESTWVTPIAFLVISIMDIRGDRSSHKTERSYILLSILVLLVYFIARYIAIGQFVDVYEGERFLNFDMKGIAVNYVKLVLRSFSRQSGNLYLVISALFIGITAFLSFLITKRKILARGLVVLWLASYLPYLSLGIDTFGTEGERYLYLPSIFLCIILGLGIVNAARVYKYVISLLFLTIHILLLYDARKNYEVASAVTKATVKELENTGPGTHIYFLCLPEENNGALIFREGIRQAARLYTDSSNKITPLTTCERNFDFFHGVSEEDPSGTKGTKGAQVIFDYSKQSLVISYLPAGTISE
jgi:hypothetical protein